MTPTSAYGPFPYSNAAQRSTFQAFVDCAAEHGIQYQGPFTDSTGNGIYFHLASGEKASRADREKVTEDCPQATVGLFATPVGHLHVRSFEHIATEFVRCLRSHGYQSFPFPSFGAGDPLDAFWRVPFNWSSARFTDTVKACVEPLRSYLFSG